MILALLAAADYGRSAIMMGAGTPPGWKTERWQAGFGSWASGGYGVAYDISMPKDYSFQQKCGNAWVSDDPDEFRLQRSAVLPPRPEGQARRLRSLLERRRRAKLRNRPDGCENGGEDHRQSRRISIFSPRFHPRRRKGALCRVGTTHAGRPGERFLARGWQTEHHRRSARSRKGCDQRARRRIDPEGEGIRLYRVARRNHSGIDGLLNFEPDFTQVRELRALAERDRLSAPFNRAPDV